MKKYFSIFIQKYNNVQKKVAPVFIKLKIIPFLGIPLAVALIVYFQTEGLVIPSIVTYILVMIILYFWHFTRKLLGGLVVSVITFAIIILLFVILLLYIFLIVNKGDFYSIFNIFDFWEKL